MSEISIFKKCSMCSKEWLTRDEFIKDPSLEINGYKADFEKLDWSLFYFTHKVEGCYSTMVIEAEHFLSLYKGTRYTERRTEEEECPRYCHDMEQLERCDAICECAFNREIIQLIKEGQNRG